MTYMELKLDSRVQKCLVYSVFGITMAEGGIFNALQ